MILANVAIHAALVSSSVLGPAAPPAPSAPPGGDECLSRCEVKGGSDGAGGFSVIGGSSAAPSATPAGGRQGTAAQSVTIVATRPFCDLVPATSKAECLAQNACAAPDQLQTITYTTRPDGTIYKSNGGCQRYGPSQVDVQAAALRATERVIPTTFAVGIQPRSGAVTQLPLIVGASDDQARDVALNVVGVPVEVHLMPSWTWSFGDGTSQQTSTPGRAYDGTDPTQAGEGYYVQHTYRSKGQVRLVVDAHWTATVTRGDTGATFPLTGKVLREQAVNFPVREARAQLTH